MLTFEPTSMAGHAQLERFDPAAYSRTRNQLDGAVSRLSPYLTHGLLSLAEVFQSVHARHPLSASDKFVFELGWRAYYRHVWRFIGNGIHDSLHEGLLPDEAYLRAMPDDVLEARTGIPVIDRAVQQLYLTGYLHNHARMWLASYLVHLRKVHWHVGAQWLVGHLIDGDLASNHLSWQWIAATGSVKPYLFNAENVAKFAPLEWHSFGTAIDTSYEALSDIARGTALVAVEDRALGTDGGLREPSTFTRPNHFAWTEPDPALSVGRDVWLVHPWSLGGQQRELPQGVLRIGVAFAECHDKTPWSERRWDFVTRGLQQHTQHLWWGETKTIATALKHARSVQWQAELHVDDMLDELRKILAAEHPIPSITAYLQADLFALVSDYCPSFSKWWRRTTLITS